VPVFWPHKRKALAAGLPPAKLLGFCNCDDEN
jgi:hypothetical protein